MWRLDKIEALKGHRGAVIPTQKSRLAFPVNLLYPIEYVRNDKMNRTSQLINKAFLQLMLVHEEML